jgi:cytochrome P450
MVLLTPEAAELVTTTRNYPMHQEVSRYLTPLLGEDAIGASDGDKWKMMHGILAPAFRTSNIKPMASVIADQVLGLFQPALAKYAQSGEIFSMAEVAAEVVFSISSRVVLGTVSEKANAQLLLDINDIVDYAGTLTLTTANNPVDRAVKWWKKGAAVRRIDSFLEVLIEERYARIKHTFGNRNPKDNLTILDHILANGHGSHSNHIDPERLKPAFLRIVIDKWVAHILLCEFY